MLLYSPLQNWPHHIRSPAMTTVLHNEMEIHEIKDISPIHDETKDVP